MQETPVYLVKLVISAGNRRADRAENREKAGAALLVVSHDRQAKAAHLRRHEHRGI